MNTQTKFPEDAPPLASPLSQPALPLDPGNVGPAVDYSGESNLALAFLCLPRGKREDMNVFYTFCRVVDDIADSGQFTPDQKLAQLDAWRRALVAVPGGTTGEATGNPAERGRLLEQVRSLIARYGLPTEHFLEIIAGCEMDVRPREYATFQELQGYCHRVASVVGLVSVEIFGYRPEHAEACRRYAADLGLALQLTNIIRDVAKDVRQEGRVYLPLEDLARFGLSAEALRELPPEEAPGSTGGVRTAVRGAELRRGAWTETDARLRELLRFEADRAEKFYRRAAEALPKSERRTMVAAEIMRAIYHRLLVKMRQDRFAVFNTDYRLGRAAKLWTLATVSLVGQRPPRPTVNGGESVRNAGARRLF